LGVALAAGIVLGLAMVGGPTIRLAID
jgi:hypothetical protein